VGLPSRSRFILTPDGGVEQDPRIWWATLTRLVQRLLSKQADAGAGGLRFLPWLVGERTPVENPHVRGGFCRLSLQHGRAELARAVLEGVALNARWLLEAVEMYREFRARYRVESRRWAS
jgi:sugar (pentulose or hexulose) kinase